MVHGLGSSVAGTARLRDIALVTAPRRGRALRAPFRGTTSRIHALIGVAPGLRRVGGHTERLAAIGPAPCHLVAGMRHLRDTGTLGAEEARTCRHRSPGPPSTGTRSSPLRRRGSRGALASAVVARWCRPSGALVSAVAAHWCPAVSRAGAGCRGALVPGRPPRWCQLSRAVVLNPSLNAPRAAQGRPARCVLQLFAPTASQQGRSRTYRRDEVLRCRRCGRWATGVVQE